MLRKSTKAYKNKLRYIREYGKAKTKRFLLQLNKEKDADIIEHLNNQPCKIDYVRKLIREDMNKNK